jgi:hypothetical protein
MTEDAGVADDGAFGESLSDDGPDFAGLHESFQPAHGETAPHWPDIKAQFSPEVAIFNYEINRVNQTLMAAGVDHHMLGKMGRAALLKKLFVSSQVFEEDHVLHTIMTQTYGVRDALTETDAERAAKEGTIHQNAAQSAAAALNARTMVAGFEELPLSVQHYWLDYNQKLDGVSTELSAAMKRHASDAELDGIYQRFRQSRPDYIVPEIEMMPDAAPQLSADAPDISMQQAVQSSGQDQLDNFLQQFEQRMRKIDMKFPKKVENTQWRDYVTQGEISPPSTPHMPGAAGSHKLPPR